MRTWDAPKRRKKEGNLGLKTYPQKRLAKPTIMPEAKMAYPALRDSAAYSWDAGTLSSFVCRIMATITPYIATASQNITLFKKNKSFQCLSNVKIFTKILKILIAKMPRSAWSSKKFVYQMRHGFYTSQDRQIYDMYHLIYSFLYYTTVKLMVSIRNSITQLITLLPISYSRGFRCKF